MHSHAFYAQIWLELAMAYEATGQRQRAQDIYKRLARSAVETVHRSARQLSYGIEAMAKLKYTDLAPYEMSKVS